MIGSASRRQSWTAFNLLENQGAGTSDNALGFSFCAPSIFVNSFAILSSSVLRFDKSPGLVWIFRCDLSWRGLGVGALVSGSAQIRQAPWYGMSRLTNFRKGIAMGWKFSAFQQISSKHGRRPWNWMLDKELALAIVLPTSVVAKIPVPLSVRSNTICNILKYNTGTKGHSSSKASFVID